MLRIVHAFKFSVIFSPSRGEENKNEKVHCNVTRHESGYVFKSFIPLVCEQVILVIPRRVRKMRIFSFDERQEICAANHFLQRLEVYYIRCRDVLLKILQAKHFKVIRPSRMQNLRDHLRTVLHAFKALQQDELPLLQLWRIF